MQVSLRPSYQVGVVMVESGQLRPNGIRDGDESIVHHRCTQTEPRKGVFVRRATKWCPRQDELQQVPVKGVHYDPSRLGGVLITSCQHVVVRWLGPRR